VAAVTCVFDTGRGAVAQAAGVASPVDDPAVASAAGGPGDRVARGVTSWRQATRQFLGEVWVNERG